MIELNASSSSYLNLALNNTLEVLELFYAFYCMLDTALRLDEYPPLLPSAQLKFFLLIWSGPKAVAIESEWSLYYKLKV